MPDLATLKADIDTAFSRDRFKIERRPVIVGSITSDCSPQKNPCCLDMLVKIPGGEVVVPSEFMANNWIRDFIQASIDFEDVIFPSWRETHYAYLTVDSRFVDAGLSHRRGGWHFDGMQGTRYPNKLKACHEYIMADCLPTEFTDQATDADNLSEDRHNWFVELGKQVSEDTVFRHKPNEIVLMSVYQLHRSAVATEKEAGWRNFVRLDISMKQQDRLGNTINPQLPAPFEYVERPLPEAIRTPEKSTTWKGAVTFDSK